MVTCSLLCDSFIWGRNIGALGGTLLGDLINFLSEFTSSSSISDLGTDVDFVLEECSTPISRAVDEGGAAAHIYNGTVLTPGVLNVHHRAVDGGGVLRCI